MRQDLSGASPGAGPDAVSALRERLAFSQRVMEHAADNRFVKSGVGPVQAHANYSLGARRPPGTRRP